MGAKMTQRERRSSEAAAERSGAMASPAAGVRRMAQKQAEVRVR